MGATDLADLGEKERAKDWALRSLILEPDDMINHYNLACFMAETGETDQALDLLEVYVGKMPPIRINRIKLDADLKSLHDHPRFRAIIARGEARFAEFQGEQTAKAR